MQSNAISVELYLDELPEKWKETIQKLRIVIKTNIPEGFEETMIYGMIGYVVPKSIYPKGYHTNTSDPLPFVSIAGQKSYIAIYHLGIYTRKDLYDWFICEYEKEKGRKLDIGKSCMRFKNENEVPFELIKELIQKISVDEWISMYEKGHKLS